MLMRGSLLKGPQEMWRQSNPASMQYKEHELTTSWSE